MRSSLLVVALWVGGCGRVYFDAVDLIDANVVSDASTLVACPVAATAPATVSISGIAFRYTDFSNTWQTVPGATVTASSVVTGTVLGQTTGDGGGVYSVSIPTGGQPTPVVLEIVPGGQFFATVEVLDLPLDADLSAPAMTTNDVFSPADAPVWDTNGINAIYQQIGRTRDTTRGSLNVAIRDCLDAPVFGVTVELDPPSELLRYQAPDGKASATLTSTGPPFGHALAFNSPQGPTRIIARKDGVIVADETVDVRGGSVYTITVVRAPGA